MVGPWAQMWPSATVQVQMSPWLQVAAHATQICMTLMATWLSNTNMASGFSPDYRPLHGPLWQQELQISTRAWLLQSHGSRHSPRQQSSSGHHHRSGVETQACLQGLAPVGVAQPSHPDMVIGGGPASGRPQGPRWYHEPQTSTQTTTASSGPWALT